MRMKHHELQMEAFEKVTVLHNYQKPKGLAMEIQNLAKIYVT